ncbi:MAG TPA: STAS domain-containing protein [Terriglobales bacterium]|nr:STAS domain-containing protein [Terriglobales bacterium]
MLRITVQTEGNKTVLKLDGKITGPWVQELEGCWETLRRVQAGKKMVVDLADVSFVNGAGSQLLEHMHGEGAELLGEGPLTRSIVEEIEGRATTAHGKVG